MSAHSSGFRKHHQMPAFAFHAAFPSAAGDGKHLRHNGYEVTSPNFLEVDGWVFHRLCRGPGNSGNITPRGTALNPMHSPWDRGFQGLILLGVVHFFGSVLVLPAVTWLLTEQRDQPLPGCGLAVYYEKVPLLEPPKLDPFGGDPA